MGKLRRILERYEKWCMDWKRSITVSWIISNIVQFLYFHPALTTLNTFLWISWGVGYRIPQDTYLWIQKRWS